MEKLRVSSNPHDRSRVTTNQIMLMVVIALLPATVFGIFNFGLNAFLLIVISIVTCVLTEGIYEMLMHKKLTVTDFSAVVTGLLLALNLPPEAPWWIPILGGVFAILIVKQLFGGLGQNIMNPALAARCFLLLSFTGIMTDFSVSPYAQNHIADVVSSATQGADAVSGATLLAEIKAGTAVDGSMLLDMFVGNIRGTIGETSAIALLIGGIFLVAMKVISLRIPLTYIGSFAVFYAIFGGHGIDPMYLAAEICGGGLMLGAWFMATDYVTAPLTRNGQLVYGVILGFLTGIFRVFGGSAEGVSYAIIFSNLLVPLIERVTVPRAFGKGGKRHE